MSTKVETARYVYGGWGPLVLSLGPQDQVIKYLFLEPLLGSGHGQTNLVTSLSYVLEFGQTVHICLGSAILSCLAEVNT